MRGFFADVHPLVRLAVVALLLALVLAPLWVGSVQVQSAAVLAALTSMAALCVVGIRLTRGREEGEERSHHRVSVGPLTWVMGLGALWSALQLVPLPLGVVKGLSPRRWLAHQEALEAGLRCGQEWITLTLDPGSSADMLLRFVCLMGALCAIENLPTRLRKGSWLLYGVLCSGGVSAVVGLAHNALGIERFLGFYEAERAPTWGSTFVNGNQAAALYAVCVMVSVALAVSRQRQGLRQRIPYILSAGCFGAMMSLQESAGSWGVMVMGVGVCALLLVLPLGELALRWRAALVAGLLGSWPLLWLMAWWGRGTERDSMATRFEMVRAALSRSRDFWLTGSGAWSVERALSPELQWNLVGNNRVETIEAEALEWFLTLGWPVTLMMLTGLVLGVAGPLLSGRPRHRRAASAVAMGMMVLGLAQLHFPFYIIGLGLPMMVAWGSMWGQAMGRRGNHAARPEGAEEEEAPQERIEQLVARMATLASGVSFGRLGGGVLVLLMVVMGGLSAYRLAVWPQRWPDRRVMEATSDELDQLACAIPTESSLYMRRVELSQEGEAPVSKEHELVLMRRAYALEPTQRFEVLVAMLAWRAGEEQEALQRFASVLEYRGPDAFARGGLAMLETIPDASHRAQVMRGQPPKQWEIAWRAIMKVEGELAAQEFLMALGDALPESTSAQVMLLDFYISQKRWELVEMWGLANSMSELDDMAGLRRALVRAKLESVRALGEEGALTAYMLPRLDALAKDEVLATWVLDEAPRLLRADKGSAPFIEQARQARCRGALSKSVARQCSSARAWLAEVAGEAEEAERIWKALSQTMSSPSLLGAYYGREGKCTSIRILVQQVEARQNEGPRMVRELSELRAQLETCEQVPVTP